MVAKITYLKLIADYNRYLIEIEKFNYEMTLPKSCMAPKKLDLRRPSIYPNKKPLPKLPQNANNHSEQKSVTSVLFRNSALYNQSGGSGSGNSSNENYSAGTNSIVYQNNSNTSDDNSSIENPKNLANLNLAYKNYPSYKNCSESYHTAYYDLACVELSPSNPNRLVLALNYSIFLKEIDEDSEAACRMAKSAFDHALGDLDNLTEDSYKDATMVMQLLRDNLILWSDDDSFN